MLKVLIVSGSFSIIVDMVVSSPSERKYAWIEGTAILIAVVLVAGVGSFVDWRKEIAFMQVKLKQREKLVCIVMRNGINEEIHQDLLHVGDLVLIQYGMKVPVDGVCVFGSQLKMDESAMTGESDALPKESFENCVKRMEEVEMEKRASKSNDKNAHDLPSPVIMSGTSVSEGEGMMISIAVGDMSSIG